MGGLARLNVDIDEVINFLASHDIENNFLFLQENGETI
jgi:hypothetical protein